MDKKNLARLAAGATLTAGLGVTMTVPAKARAPERLVHGTSGGGGPRGTRPHRPEGQQLRLRRDLQRHSTPVTP